MAPKSINHVSAAGRNLLYFTLQSINLKEYSKAPPLRNSIFQDSLFHFSYKYIFNKSDFMYQYAGNSRT